MNCKCHPDCAFHWKDNKRPSIFMRDTYFTANASALATAGVEKQRAQGKEPGTILGMSAKGAENIRQFKNRSNILAQRTVTAYSKAVPK